MIHVVVIVCKDSIDFLHDRFSVPMASQVLLLLGASHPRLPATVSYTGRRCRTLDAWADCVHSAGQCHAGSHEAVAGSETMLLGCGGA